MTTFMAKKQQGQDIKRYDSFVTKNKFKQHQDEKLTTSNY